MLSKQAFNRSTIAVSLLAVAWRKQRQGKPILAFSFGLAVLDVLLIWCYHAYVYPRCFSPLRDIPLVPGYTWYGGNTLQRDGEVPFPCDPSREWVENANTELLRFFDLRHIEHIVTVSPQAVQELLATKCYDFEKPKFLKSGLMLAVVGNGLLFAEGNIHKRFRKQLTPAFSFRHVKDLVPTFWSCSTSLVRAVEAQRVKDLDTVEIEPNVWASRATLDIIGEAGLGRSFNALKKPDQGVSRSYGRLYELDTANGMLVRVGQFLIPTWVFRIMEAMPLKLVKEAKEHIGGIRDACRAMVVEKQAMLRKTADTPSVDILSGILSLKEVSISEDQMVEHLLTFLGAGHETTASAMAWALLVLCKRPEVERRLRQEIWKQTDSGAWGGATEKPITAADLDKMPYLQAFCNEVLRVYPPVPMTAREAVVDTSLAGHPIPKGTTVILPIWGNNNSTALWGPDAAAFRPERWLESASGGCKSAYALQTFLAGPRSCIGGSFAKHEFLCLVAAWVGRFETRFAPVNGEWKEPIPYIVAGLTCKPMAGWRAQIKVINRPCAS